MLPMFHGPCLGYATDRDPFFVRNDLESPLGGALAPSISRLLLPCSHVTIGTHRQERSHAAHYFRTRPCFYSAFPLY